MWFPFPDRTTYQRASTQFTESLRVTSGPTLPAQAGQPRTACPRTMFWWFLSISKDGDSNTSLGNLCYCSINLTVKNCFLIFRGSLPCFSLRPLPLFLSLGTTEKSLVSSSSFPFKHFFIDKIPLGLLQARQSYFPQPLLMWKILPVLWSSLWPCTGLALASPCLSCARECRTDLSTQLQPQQCIACEVHSLK